MNKSELLKKIKTKIASSGTLSGINKLVNEYFYSDKKLIKISEDCYAIQGRKNNKDYISESFIVIFNNNKFYLYELKEKIKMIPENVIQDKKMEKSKLDKMIEDMIIKALSEAKSGEGSRGGKVIGHTKSGKPIYASQNAKLEKSYNAEDHKDAAYAHLDRATEHYKNGHETQGNVHNSEFDRHFETSRHKKRNQELDKEYPKIKKEDIDKDNEEIDEMSTTAGVPGYQTPGAFSSTTNDKVSDMGGMTRVGKKENADNKGREVPVVTRSLKEIVNQILMNEDWWNDLGVEGQKDYIDSHPNSKKAKDAKQKSDSKPSKKKEDNSLDPQTGKRIKFYQPKINKEKESIKFANDSELKMAKKYLEKSKGVLWKELPNKEIKFLQTAEFKDMIKKFGME